MRLKRGEIENVCMKQNTNNNNNKNIRHRIEEAKRKMFILLFSRSDTLDRCRSTVLLKAKREKEEEQNKKYNIVFDMREHKQMNI